MRPRGCCCGGESAASAPETNVETESKAMQRSVENIRIEIFSHQRKVRRSTPVEVLLPFYYYSFKCETVYLPARYVAHMVSERSA